MNSFDCVSLCYYENLKGRREIGRQIVFQCPGPSHIRGDKKPSLWIDPNKGVGGYWKCFPCGAGGGRWELAAFLGGYSWPMDYKLVLDWLRDRGLISYAKERKSQRTTASRFLKFKMLNHRS